MYKTSRLSLTGCLSVLAMVIVPIAHAQAPFTNDSGQSCQYMQVGTRFFAGDPPQYPSVPDHIVFGYRCDNPGSGDPIPEDGTGEPDAPGCSSPKAGNPINVATGNKYQIETDFVGLGLSPLTFRRTYNSQHIANNALETALYPGRLGGQWRHNYEGSVLVRSTSDTNYEEALVITSDGRAIAFYGPADGSTGATAGEHEWFGNVTRSRDGRLYVTYDSNGDYTEWRFVKRGLTNKYSASGDIIEKEVSKGVRQEIAYSNGRLHEVRNLAPFTGKLVFGYATSASNAPISSVTFPDSTSVSFTRDGQGNLSTVSYPAVIGSGTVTKQYHYENTSFTKALTGITDEEGIRFATWTYDSAGRANSSEHAGGVEKVTMDYTNIAHATDPRVVVTNALNKDTIYHFEDIGGVRRVKEFEGIATANCAAADLSFEYDSNGFMTKMTDRNGNVTTYDRDAFGFEESRTEAFGSTVERTISTNWNHDKNVPILITEPDRLIELTYDTEGRILTRTVKETP